MPKLDFCIVIPVYNEEKIILDTISKALKFSKKYSSKIIIVNDGSTDSTKKKKYFVCSVPKVSLFPLNEPLWRLNHVSTKVVTCPKPILSEWFRN